MTHDEFVDWLRLEVRTQRMTERQMIDLLEQKSLFDDGRPIVASALTGRIVGYIAGHRMEADDLHILTRQAQTRYPGRMLYFEPIEFTLF